MKYLIFILFLCVLSFAESPKIYTKDGKYLGNLNNNELDPESVSNELGRYGSPISPDSINNPIGKYGSPISTQSVDNPYFDDNSSFPEEDAE